MNMKLVKSVSIFLVAFSCQNNVFPVFSELQTKTNEECLRSSRIGLVITFSLYFVISILGLIMFGSQIESSLLKNVGHECSPGSLSGIHLCPWESYFLRGMFLVVLGCHIPFAFYSGKESLLIMIDEVDRRSISSALPKKLAQRKLLSLDPLSSTPRGNQHGVDLYSLNSEFEVESVGLHSVSLESRDGKKDTF